MARLDNFIARRNLHFRNINDLTSEGMHFITATEWENCVRHVLGIEGQNWTQAGDSVLGFAKAMFKGFSTYSEAAASMSASGFSDFNVFDGENTYNKSMYEQSKGFQSCTLNANATEHVSTEQESENESTAIHNTEQRANVYRVYIDGSCIRSGASTAQAGYGLYWGDQHPWNCSNPLPQDGTATNNKAELAAAIKALHIARDHKLEQLITYSDSNCVILGITEWVYKWKENGWKTAGGEDVKNKEVWIDLSKLSEASTSKIIWKHVAAHSGISGNEEADKLAVQGAKQITAKAQRSEGVKCNDTINPAIDKHTDFNTQPKVIYVQEKDTNANRQSTMKEHTTPIRKATRDRSNTPVPGSMNGFCVSAQSSKSVAGNSKVKTGRSIENNESEGDSHTLKFMNNMETILRTIVTELHQLREDQLEFKKEVKQQILTWHFRQTTR